VQPVRRHRPLQPQVEPVGEHLLQRVREAGSRAVVGDEDLHLLVVHRMAVELPAIRSKTHGNAQAVELNGPRSLALDLEHVHPGERPVGELDRLLELPCGIEGEAVLSAEAAQDQRSADEASSSVERRVSPFNRRGLRRSGLLGGCTNGEADGNRDREPN
jgi:hypothetical protein